MADKVTSDYKEANVQFSPLMRLFYGPIIMLLLVTTVQVYVEAFAEEDGGVIGSAVSSLAGRDKHSHEDDIDLYDAGSTAIAEEG